MCHRGLLLLWLLTMAAAAMAQDRIADIALPTGNYAHNGGFERGMAGWEVFAGHRFSEVATDERHSGQSSLKVAGLVDDYRYVNQAGVPLTPGCEYTLSAWIKCQGFERAGDNAQFLNLTNYGWTASAQLNPLQADQDWTYYQVTFTAPPTQEANGKPSYTLVVFWPIHCKGTVWVDDIQIEEGPAATPYRESFVGWGIAARDDLGRARSAAAGALASLRAGLSGMTIPPGLITRAEAALAAIDAQAARLRSFADLPPDEAEALPDEAQRLSAAAADLNLVLFTANPYLPVSEVALPAEQPAALGAKWSLLQDERRAIALAAANLSPDAQWLRLSPGPLTGDDGRPAATSLPWVRMYTVPPMRGWVKPWEKYTDALVEMDQAGQWVLAGNAVSQAVLVCDTTDLLPGRYHGEVLIGSLSGALPPRTVAFNLTVQPVALAPLRGIDVCDIGAMAPYALDSIGPLGLNTFTISAQWLAPEANGAVDFSRVRPLIETRLKACPEARFWIGFGAGAVVSEYLGRTRGLHPPDQAWRDAIVAWARGVVDGFARLGVPADRLVFETVDEPGPGQIDEAIELARLIKQTAPTARTQSFVTSFSSDDADLRRMYEAHDIIAPGFTSITTEAVATLRGMGKQVWVYDCQNSAETFHPISYYRLLPWLAWRHGLSGWGHFSMLDSEPGRGYTPWEGVAEESLVYPAADGGQVISRRWLALEAGTQDYQALAMLQHLTAAARAAGVAADAVVAAERMLADAPAAMLEMPLPGRPYYTRLCERAVPDRLDECRETIAGLAGSLAVALPPVRGEATLDPAGATVHISADRATDVRVRYLRDHSLPWRVASASLPAGGGEVALGDGMAGPVNGAVAEVVDDLGRISTIPLQPVVRAQVDSTMPPYSAARVADGLAVAGMKFEPESGWIGGGSGGEHWVELTLERPVPCRGLKVWWMTFGGLPQAVKLQVWTGGEWRDASGFADWHAARAAVEELTCEPVVTDRLRVLQRAGCGGPGCPTLMGLSEVELIQ